MKKWLFIMLLAGLTTQSGAAIAEGVPRAAQAEAHYRIYDAAGRAVTMEDVLAALDRVEVACVGELHDDPTAHLFEAELLKLAFAHNAAPEGSAKGRTLTLSLEMFERDVQIVLDEYLGGLINERHFLASSRPWKNYETDYRPLVEFASQHHLAVIAANAPARYVNRVSRLGPASLRELTNAARAWLPPLPYAAASAAYAAKFNGLMSASQMPAGAQGQPPPHGNSFLLDAQSLRDATMAYAITQQLKQRPPALVIHVNGSFHSEEHLGVPEQLRHYRPQTRTLVLTIVSDQSYPNFDAARLGKLGDFIILTDPALPRSR